MPQRLTIQQLANLCNFSWEVEQRVCFCLTDPMAFRAYIARAQPAELASLLINLSELFKTAREIGQAEVELQATGEHPFLARLDMVRTPTAASCDANEHLEIPLDHRNRLDSAYEDIH